MKIQWISFRSCDACRNWLSGTVLSYRLLLVWASFAGVWCARLSSAICTTLDIMPSDEWCVHRAIQTCPHDYQRGWVTFLASYNRCQLVLLLHSSHTPAFLAVCQSSLKRSLPRPVLGPQFSNLSGFEKNTCTITSDIAGFFFFQPPMIPLHIFGKSFSHFLAEVYHHNCYFWQQGAKLRLRENNSCKLQSLSRTASKKHKDKVWMWAQTRGVSQVSLNSAKHACKTPLGIKLKQKKTPGLELVTHRRAMGSFRI